ncbi:MULTISPECIES: hypothetical protein [Paenibacillus]|uniref:hypothetical protein n=1 Tax=Paenibacillus TaxID=44249 RepID=UPI0022817B4B|nr:hypothetical protein [Paenibacillus alvei]MCY7486975.1 hypothetical protein [Paenibacillus alvei]
MKKRSSVAKKSGTVQPQATISADDNDAPEVTATGKGKEKESIFDHCQKHMHRFVRVQTHDGVVYQAIVESVDQNYISLAVPTCTHAEPVQASETNMPIGNLVPYMEMERSAYGYYPQPRTQPYPYPGTPYVKTPFIDPHFPGYCPDYYYPYGYGKRFGKVVLPLAGLADLSLLPFY